MDNNITNIKEIDEKAYMAAKTLNEAVSVYGDAELLEAYETAYVDVRDKVAGASDAEG